MFVLVPCLIHVLYANSLQRILAWMDDHTCLRSAVFTSSVMLRSVHVANQHPEHQRPAMGESTLIKRYGTHRAQFPCLLSNIPRHLPPRPSYTSRQLTSRICLLTDHRSPVPPRHLQPSTQHLKRALSPKSAYTPNTTTTQPQSWLPQKRLSLIHI